ncbi:glycosyl transferase, partial [Nguyenibacter vanlangensis]|nr:glycosyl transferase [Nguyenibacter vanlangensis]
SMASFVPTLRRFGLPAAWALLLPAIASFYSAATIGSAIDHHRGRGVVWKSRAYTEATGAGDAPAP